MEALVIKKTEKTPGVVLNKETGKFIISQTSWPENAKEFYEPIIKWLENYFENNPLDETVFQIRLTYMNTSSSKQIAKILALLKKYSSKHNIKIQWYYEKGDIDMKNDAIRFATLLNLKIEIIEL